MKSLIYTICNSRAAKPVLVCIVALLWMYSVARETFRDRLARARRQRGLQ